VLPCQAPLPPAFLLRAWLGPLLTFKDHANSTWQALRRFRSARPLVQAGTDRLVTGWGPAGLPLPLLLPRLTCNLWVVCDCSEAELHKSSAGSPHLPPCDGRAQQASQVGLPVRPPGKGSPPQGVFRSPPGTHFPAARPHLSTISPPVCFFHLLVTYKGTGKGPEPRNLHCRGHHG
jgi:hypothetical protein